ncbi:MULTISPECIES: hypothetical protein [Bacillus cereus group]|uniref:DUF4259 domain-containing protein n=2 Tax=Bacillus thuringiensis TaxID=1428 RepID=A0AAW9JFX2_BACTU|nr:MULTISPECIES: hypothetical protein [Bacillus cereus group]EEM43700.1 hypothetical protein bthur0004_3150 [Bacillus thuringiensis serovar sotto str. T04001]AFQ17266.1 hypothetical protein BTG_19215 [Bacillus thuringiensis HD-771]AZV64427.1 hypothetical protein DT426_01470 [Bacillus cereus]KAA0822912.1 hypothetical protein DN403_18675 [Bacillus sp. AY2-1]MBJ8025165.1 hypothetical protein [Bacillus cereus]
MGAWGVAILSDDIAKDIQLIYKDLLGNEYSNEEASRVVIDEYQTELDDEEILVFWLAFAYIQWKLGRLQDNVKHEALQIIESGADLARWEEEPTLQRKREVVLNKLREQLHSPQPQAKKIPKRFIANTSLKAGDAVSYELVSGKYIILKVIEIIEEWYGDRYPLFEICDWEGKEIPSKEQIDQLDLKKRIYEDGKQEIIKLAIYPSGKRDNPEKRIQVVAEDVNVVLDIEPPYDLICWKEFDEHLDTM